MCNLELKFQVSELFHDLKMRVSAFNMYINAQPSDVDEEFVCKQRFILQVMFYWLLGKSHYLQYL